MDLPNTLVSWVVWFYDTFISPLVDIMKNTDILGYTFFQWALGFAVVGLAVRFIRDLFQADGKE